MQITHDVLNRKVTLDLNGDENSKMEYLLEGQPRAMRELIGEWLDRETKRKNQNLDERIAKRLASATVAEKQAVLAALKLN